jgi:hypothetical protein
LGVPYDRAVQRVMRWLVGGALAATAAAGAGLAADPPTFPISGLEGRELRVGGVQRTSDGGALIGAAVERAGRGGWRPAVIRLRVDGTVDLAYGSAGISTPPAVEPAVVTALTADPVTGAAWVGLAVGRPPRAEVIALDGHGNRNRRFGRRGTLDLGAEPGPTAIAWAPHRLLVANGRDPCAGCQLALIDPATGATLARGSLPGECSGGAVSGAAFTADSLALVGLNGSGGAGCPAALTTVSVAGWRGAAAPATSTAQPLGANAARELVGVGGGSVCLAASSPDATLFGPYLTAGGSVTVSRGAAGRLIAVVSLGQNACGVLIAAGRHGLVLQASAAHRTATVDPLSRAVTPLGMFRCQSHLVVIGARHAGGRAYGVVAVVPVRRGSAAGLTRAMAGGSATRNGRCTVPSE